MTNQSVQTALALYSGGTLDLQTAARTAGVAPARLERTARRLSVPVPDAPEHERERVRVGAD